MATTSHLGMTLVEQGQAQKEVTINTALTRIDAILNTGAKDKDLATPPGSPAAGDVYIVAASATGAWAGQEGKIAYFDQAWRFITPNEGISLWVNDENLTYAYNGSAWVASVPTLITVADTTDSTCFVGLFESATGNLAPKTDAAATYDASVGAFGAMQWRGAISYTALGVNNIRVGNNGNAPTIILENATGVGSIDQILGEFRFVWNGSSIPLSIETSTGNLNVLGNVVASGSGNTKFNTAGGNFGIGVSGTPNGFQVGTAVTPSALGVTNVRMGLNGTTPSLLLENNTSGDLFNMDVGAVADHLRFVYQNSSVPFDFDLNTGDAAFAGNLTVADEAYGSGWNGSLEVPTKNAVYDKIETLSSGGGVSLLAMSTTAASHTGDTSETTVLDYTLPAGTLPANGALRITPLFSRNSGGAGTVTVRVRFSTISGTIYYTNAISTGVLSNNSIVHIYANNSTGAQKGPGASSSGIGNSSAAMVTSSVDTTADTHIVVTVQCANSGDTGTLEGYTIELLKI